MTADPDDSLATALLDSRTRWRDLALLAADLLFETDAAGRFVFIAPETVLGHPAEALLGTAGVDLLLDRGAPDPFDPAIPPRGLRAWLDTPDRGPACLEFTARRLPGGGLRGTGRDVTEAERQGEATARVLRRATSLTRLFGLAQRGRAEGAAAAPALDRLLSGVCGALGCSGAALLDETAQGWQVAAAFGALGAMPQPDAPPAAGLALVPASAGLMLAAWCDTPPDAEDLELLAALGPSLAGLQAEAKRQRELARAARTDPLTGLLNRRGFAEALAEGRARRPAGMLAYLDMDGLKALNDRHGHAAGDAAIQALAARLAAAIGPGELAARLGGDEFALWLPEVEAERARARCAALGAPGPLPGCPAAGPAAVAASIGFAAVAPGDAVEPLIAEADAAMYGFKRARRAA